MEAASGQAIHLEPGRSVGERGRPSWWESALNLASHHQRDDGVLGQASGIKMCYASMTKGITALATELLVAAKAMGLDAQLKAEFGTGPGAVIPWLERSVPSMPPKAYRWVGEMEEIAATFEYLGMTPSILLGAADMYRFVEGTALGAETPEARTRGGRRGGRRRSGAQGGKKGRQKAGEKARQEAREAGEPKEVMISSQIRVRNQAHSG